MQSVAGRSTSAWEKIRPNTVDELVGCLDRARQLNGRWTGGRSTTECSLDALATSHDRQRAAQLPERAGRAARQRDRDAEFMAAAAPQQGLR